MKEHALVIDNDEMAVEELTDVLDSLRHTYDCVDSQEQAWELLKKRGYSYVLLVIAFFRELLGAGSIWGLRVLGDGWENWAIMVMAPGAFFMLALFIWIVKGLILKADGNAKEAS